jgi:hypothetical protein
VQHLPILLGWVDHSGADEDLAKLQFGVMLRLTRADLLGALSADKFDRIFDTRGDVPSALEALQMEDLDAEQVD